MDVFKSLGCLNKEQQPSKPRQEMVAFPHIGRQRIQLCSTDMSHISAASHGCVLNVVFLAVQCHFVFYFKGNVTMWTEE